MLSTTMSNVQAVNIASKALQCSRWRSPVSLISIACPKPLPISPFLPFLYPSSHPNSHTISLRSFQRPLCTTNGLRKSKNKDKVNKHNASNIDRAEAKVAATTDDPFDFTQYEADITRAQEDLKAQLAKIRVNALDAEAVESLRVTLGPVKAEGGGKKAKGGGAGEEKVTIGDVASVMKRGRNIVIMVGEKDVCPPFPHSPSLLYTHLTNPPQLRHSNNSFSDDCPAPQTRPPLPPLPPLLPQPNPRLLLR